MIVVTYRNRKERVKTIRRCDNMSSQTWLWCHLELESGEEVVGFFNVDEIVQHNNEINR